MIIFFDFLRGLGMLICVAGGFAVGIYLFMMPLMGEGTRGIMGIASAGAFVFLCFVIGLQFVTLH